MNMDRRAYLHCLGQELARWVPQRERQDMLRYYEEYFDEAGPDREQAVIVGLGDPVKLARALAEEAGFVPRKGRRGRLVALAVGAGIVVSTIVVGLAVGGSVMHSSVMHTIVNMWRPDYNGALWAVTEQGTANHPMVGLEQGADITVELSLGNVMVCTGQVEQICVDQNSPSGYEVAWEVKDNRLVVEAKEGAAGVLGNESAEVIITIPEAWKLGQVRIETELGDIRLQGVWASDLDLNTELGNILVMGTSAGFLEAETGLGDVTVTETLPLDSELSTGSGDIVINANCMPGECSYDLETGLGRIYVDGRDGGSKSSYSGRDLYHVSGDTGWGDIHLDFLGN